jgi:redox-sensitive bicupin YhaK (pirin superfamily)
MSWRPTPDPTVTTADAAHAPEIVIAGRPRDLGSFSVRRTLPAPFRRSVGPFVFLDHMTPATFPPGSGLDVRPHPHIGLATVTYLFEGEILHRDSLGTVQAIQPGAINWMTAGKGIVHSERTSPERRASGSRLHALQAWVALPDAHEETEPSFFHHPAATIPHLAADGVAADILVGTAFGERSPVRTYSEMFYVNAVLAPSAALELPRDHEQRAFYVVSGAVTHGNDRYETGTLVVVPGGAPEAIRAAEAGAHVALLGGTSVGERHIFWNFVSSSKERIEVAKHAWKEERFPLVPGDEHERTPLPE